MRKTDTDVRIYRAETRPRSLAETLAETIAPNIAGHPVGMAAKTLAYVYAEPKPGRGPWPKTVAETITLNIVGHP